MFGKFFNPPQPTRSKSLNVERAAIHAHGGTSNKQLLGPDGHDMFGRALEVKYAEGDRFRVNRRAHEHMLSHNGLYIFIFRDRQIKLSANQTDRMIHYKWLKDTRGGKYPDAYDHGFVLVADLFGR